jgi:O-antigen ligase
MSVREPIVSNAEEKPDAHQPGAAARRTSEAIFVSLFFAVVLIAAVPLGANRDWAWSPIVMVLGGLAVCHALGLGIRESHVLRAAEWRLLMLLAVCFVAVIAPGIVQISPLVPPSWRSDLYARAASVLGHPVEGIISLNADATRASLLKVAACGVTFLMARATCRDRRRARLFLLLFLAIAVLVTSYGLVMQATNGSCYVFSYNKRLIGQQSGQELACSLSGTFVNSNSYAAYAGMALIVALGLTFSRRPGQQEDIETATMWLTGSRAVYLAAVLMLFGGLLLSDSRAGFAATVIAAILLGILLLRGRWPSHPAMVGLVVGAIFIAAVVVLIAGSAFFHKMSTLSEDDLLGRFRIWEVSVSALSGSPWLGYGMGSFPDLYTMLQSPDLRVPNDKAHSTPLEWILDLGIPAALCAFATLLLPLAVCLRGCWRRRTDRYLPAVAFAAVMVPTVHSIVDFSLQIPAVGLMVSALLGVGWAHAFRRYE